MKVSFNGFGEYLATFETSSSNIQGKVVKMSGNGAVSECQTGDLFCGVAVSEGSGIVGVQLGGYVRLPFSGVAPDVGYQNLCADGGGGVKASEDEGRSLLVVDVDDNEGVLGVIL